ncbi:hypothetical protein GIB67_035174 [Kingdonia uniflora]|uniref:HP domain-containing protein n=1 Tax=Kingdonia uniflora TaxID=39325 RepID=A0A7J7LDP4_9MAGN|nr:hypothetical protein GIB67_035174 [Kingdonia uniflora]
MYALEKIPAVSVVKVRWTLIPSPCWLYMYEKETLLDSLKGLNFLLKESSMSSVLAFGLRIVHGNSFEKKVLLLFGMLHASEDKSNNSSNQGGPTQRASALAALSSAFNPSSGTKSSAPRASASSQGSSQRAAAVAALSNVLTAEKKRSPDASPSRSSSISIPETSFSDGLKSEDTQSQVEVDQEASVAKEVVEDESLAKSNGDDFVANENSQADENGGDTTFSYDQLKAKSSNPVTGIDFKRREAYLSDEEFTTVMGMTKEAFYKQPRWKQDMQKKKVDLF